MYDHITRLITDSGLWDGDGAQTHGFRTTSTLVNFTPSQAAELAALGPAITEVMEGVSRIIAIAFSDELSHGTTWGMVRKVASMEVPSFMKPLQGQFAARMPLIVKVDLMEDEGGNFHVAELDATNRRGLGYTSLFELIRSAISPDHVPLGKPIITAVADLVKRLCGDRKAELGYVYAHKERFYLREFAVLKRELKGQGVELILGSERETVVAGDVVTIGGVPCTSGLLADFALLLEDRDLAKEFVRLYLEKKLRLLIPPRPFLGSKAMLALLHNAEKHPQLEAILHAHIRSEVLTRMRERIPVTRFVTRQTERPERGVLKQVMSSGMHGVHFADSPSFDAAFLDARNRSYQYVLQDEIDCRPRSFQILDQDGMTTEALRTRLVVYYVNKELSGGVITAGEGKCIHGGKRAVFTSTIRA